MYDRLNSQSGDTISPAQMMLNLMWILTFDQVYQHRQVRRIGPDPVGSRFVCVEENGAHFCTPETVEPGRAMDLYDLVPKNHADQLAEILRHSSESDGRISLAGQRSLDQILERRGVLPDQRSAMMRLKELSALDYLFQVTELALDVAYPPA